MKFFKAILVSLALVMLAGCVTSGGRTPFSQAPRDHQIILLRVMALNDFREGDTDAGIKKLDRAIGIAEAAQDVGNVVHIHIDLADAFVKLGRRGEAEGEARAALRKAKARAHRAGEAKALLFLGRLKREEAPDEARQYYRMAVEAFDKVPGIHRYAVTARLEYARILMHQDLAAAGSWVEEAVIVARMKKDQALEADALTARAELLARQGRYDEALTALSDAGRLIPGQKKYVERYARIELLRVNVLALSERQAPMDETVRNFDAFWQVFAGEENEKAKAVRLFAANLDRLGYRAAATEMGAALSLAVERWRAEDAERTRREKNAKNVIVRNRYFAQVHALLAKLQLDAGLTGFAPKTYELVLDNMPGPFKTDHLLSGKSVGYALSPTETELLLGYSQVLAASGNTASALAVLDFMQRQARPDLAKGSQLATRSSIALLKGNAAETSSLAREVLSHVQKAGQSDWYQYGGIVLDLAERERSRDAELASALARAVAEIPVYDADLRQAVRANGLLASLAAESAPDLAERFRKKHEQLSGQLSAREVRRPESS